MACACPCCCGCCCDGESGSLTKPVDCVAPDDHKGVGTVCDACCIAGSVDTTKQTQAACESAGGTWVANGRCLETPCGCDCNDVDLATALYGIEPYSWDIIRGSSRSRYIIPGDPTSGTALLGSGASTGSFAAGYGRVKGCVRWLCRCVDGSGNVLCSKTIGSVSVDLTTELETYTSYLPEAVAGCYVYTFEFFGWFKPAGTTLGGTIGAEPIWIDSSDAYKVIQTKIS